MLWSANLGTKKSSTSFDISLTAFCTGFLWDVCAFYKTEYITTIPHTVPHAFCNFHITISHCILYYHVHFVNNKSNCTLESFFSDLNGWQMLYDTELYITRQTNIDSYILSKKLLQNPATKCRATLCISSVHTRVRCFFVCFFLK